MDKLLEALAYFVIVKLFKQDSMLLMVMKGRRKLTLVPSENGISNQEYDWMRRTRS